MSWKRAQMHAEAMLKNLGIEQRFKGRKDLQGKRLTLVDDGSNEYRTMCFAIAAKLVKKRGGEVEIVKPGPGEVPHARVQEFGPPPRKPRSRTNPRPSSFKPGGI
jgi:predicted GTPase